MNNQQLTNKMTWYQKNKEKALTYQRRYKEQKRTGTLPDKYFKTQVYNKYESTITNSCIKKHRTYLPDYHTPTDYVDILLQDATHIPFKSMDFMKILERINTSHPKCKTTIPIQPQIRCKMCNIKCVPYKMFDDTYESVCVRCVNDTYLECRQCNFLQPSRQFRIDTHDDICNECFRTNYELVNGLVSNIVDDIITNFNEIDYVVIPSKSDILKEQRKACNMRYRQTHANEINIKRKMTYQKNKCVDAYKIYHIKIYKMTECGMCLMK